MATFAPSEPLALHSPQKYAAKPAHPTSSSPSSPSWPARVGDSIRVGTAGVEGIVRFVGSTSFAPGDWLGVELWHPLGKNDGTIGGRRYFSCLPMHGIFLRPHAATRGPDGTLEARRVDFTARMAAVAASGGKVDYAAVNMTSETAFGSPRKGDSEQFGPTADVSRGGVGGGGGGGGNMSCSGGNSNNNNNNINSNNSSSRDVAAPLPPPASQPMLGGSKSTPTLGRSAEEARRALAEATEDHDHAAMRLALESARSAGLASSELQGAQRILTFEAQRQLWDGMQALTKESEELRSLVQTATTKASLLESTRSIPPQEVDLNSVWSEAWLDKVAEKVEERIWKKFESRMADFTAKLLESTDQRLQRSLEEFRQACSELETVCLAETKVDFTPVTASVQESPQFSPETASLRRLSWGSSIPSARVNAGAPEASAEVDEAADSESDDEGIMRWALALAVKTGAHRNTNPPTPPPTTSKPAVDRDEVVSMSTMDTEGRSLGLLNSYADQPTPRFTPRTSPEGDAPSNAQPSARSVTSTASSPRQRLTIANSPREELVGLLHWKLDHQGTDRGSLGKDEMGLLAMMCGFVGSGERWDLEWQSLKGLHGWTDQRGVDAASLSKYLERQRVGMEELQCMCKGLNYVRGQTAIPKSEGPPQVVSLR
eukprot:CAMPEP_0206528554 /NCGR_PEP_ID=MMETSP0325_2-20121206/2049_1 /ASSEMBLY_ACC=CAM_ASM_000347 /TAXON_ID=2866 /ORGANISM="Crypthecodinium cohnii, Strain Seligo" /LENGTH=658 /DNA_ID=CAMNT_0054024249 /DNA_START=246 /DNA_END=2218 /DNA_ORIENTATION=+